MTAANSSNRPQFSMKALLGITTLACIVLAFPKGYVLLAVGTVWLLVGAALVGVLMIFKATIYRFLSGVNIGNDGKEPR